MATLAQIWRHPIKGVGREELGAVDLIEGQTLPWDRHWAIAHEDAKLDLDAPEWARCINFARAARGHRLMGVSSTFDEDALTIRLEHPDLDPLVVDMGNLADHAALVAWVTEISDPARSLPKAVIAAGRGMTDSDTPTVSIHATATLDALSESVGRPLDPRRFRGNLWVEGWDAWSEFDLIDKTLRIGGAEITVTERIERCIATTVNPDTGVQDAPTLETLNTVYGHQDFGVFGSVTKSGKIACGDTVEVL